MRIRTKTVPAKNGTGNVVARSGTKQATVRFDHSHSARWNQGNAAGELAKRLGVKFAGVTITLGHPNARMQHHAATFDLR